MMKSEKKDYTERTRAMQPDCMCTSDACARFSGNVCGRDDLEHKYDFTVIGTAATVTVLKVSEMPQQGKSTAVTGGGLQSWENGGMGLNICAGLARLGMQVYPVLTYVDSRQKEYLHQLADANSWPAEGIMDPPPDSAGTTIMIQDRRKNHMTLITEYDRRMLDSRYFMVQKMEDSFFTNSKMVILTVPMAMNTRPALEAVRRHKIPLCFSMRRDPVALPENVLREIVEEAEIIFANEDETAYIREVLGVKEIGDIFGSGKLRHYVETLGGRGSRIYTRQEAGKIAVTSVEAISPSAREAETIGAGDGYVSGFMYGYINGMDIETCAGYGSSTSSFVIEKEGSITNLPTQEQMMERYLERDNRKET